MYNFRPKHCGLPWREYNPKLRGQEKDNFMELYGSTTSPYVRKVRVLLLEKDIPCQFIIEGPSDSAGNIGKLNPLGKVPVLVRDNGDVMFDSPVIMEYVDHLKTPALLPPPSEVRWLTLQWHSLAQGIMDATVGRLLEIRRSTEIQSPEAIIRHETKIDNSLKYAADRLGESEFFVGGRFSLADIVMATALDYVDFRYTDEWHTNHPSLHRWTQAITQRESFRVTAPMK